MKGRKGRRSHCSVRCPRASGAAASGLCWRRTDSLRPRPLGLQSPAWATWNMFCWVNIYVSTAFTSMQCWRKLLRERSRGRKPNEPFTQCRVCSGHFSETTKSASLRSAHQSALLGGLFPASAWTGCEFGAVFTRGTREWGCLHMSAVEPS